jgi:hypothetical protein
MSTETCRFAAAHTVAMNAPAHDIWAVWADVRGWSSYDSALTEVRVDGNFRVGTTFTVIRGDGDAAAGVVLSVTQGEEFSDEVRLRCGTVRTHHRMEPVGGLVKVTHELEADIDLDDAEEFATGAWVELQRSLIDSLEEILATVEP